MKLTNLGKKKCLCCFEHLQQCIFSFKKVVTNFYNYLCIWNNLATHKPPQSSAGFFNPKQTFPKRFRAEYGVTFYSTTWRLQLHSCERKKKSHDPRINTISEIKQRNHYFVHSYCSKTLESSRYLLIRRNLEWHIRRKLFYLFSAQKLKICNDIVITKTY